MKKRVLAGLLTLCMLLALLPTAVLAEGPSATVATVDGTSYTDIDAAIEELNTSGGTLVLYADNAPTKGISIASDKTVVIDLNGKTLTAPCASFLNNSGDLTIKDGSGLGTGTITGSSGQILLSSGTVTMQSGNLDSTKNSGSRIANITGGSFTMTGGVLSGKTMSTSYGGLCIGANATATISGGKITTKNRSVVVKGSLTVSGTALIEVTGTDKGAIRTFDKAATVTIDGGTIDGSLNLYACDTFTINGGTFTNSSATITGDEFGSLTISNSVTVLNASNITTDVSGYVVKGTPAAGAAVYTLGIDPINAAARIGNDYYVNIWDVKKAAQPGDTIVLLQDDISIYDVGTDVTIDLNGKTAIGLRASDGANVTIVDNGETKGKLIAESFLYDTYAIQVDPGATVTVGEDVVVEGLNGVPAIFVGELSDGSDKVATLNVYGTVTSGILGSGNDHTGGTLINIYDGAVISDTNSVAIYHPQAGTINMYGGQVTGATGIEMRSGTLNVTGGSVVGTAPFEESPNSSGSTVMGVGIAVSQHGTNLDVSVNVSGAAEIIGTKYALYEKDMQDPAKTDNISVSVSGGSFAVTEEGGQAVSSENVTGFISGGTFPSAPMDEYLAEGFDLVPGPDGTVTVSSPQDNSIIPILGNEMPFVDVNRGDWFYYDVDGAWSAGLINGMTPTEYVPNGNLTVAQAIKLSAALHQLMNDGEVTLTNGIGNWYSTYVTYAVERNIIDASYLSLSKVQMDTPATRREFVHILYGTMPDYLAINAVADNAIPDVKMADACASEIYTFYRAGILTGSDGNGTFYPTNTIKRSEVAAILFRMFDAGARLLVDL